MKHYVYAAMYNDCVYESADGIISVHATKAGAYRAMRAHHVAEYNAEWDRIIESGRAYGRPRDVIQDWQRWGIKTIEVLP